MPEVLIVMATYNGDRFLTDQLDSIARQVHKNWKLWISDDGSTDETRDIVTRFMRSRPDGQVRLEQGEGRGATWNFRGALRQVQLKGAYLAFCDQDDVWDEDHLSRGLYALRPLAGSLGIYGCRMRICDENLHQIGLSPLPKRSLGFRNALVQNMLSGNTMLLTPPAATLLQQANLEAGTVVAHDWWAYQLVTGAGGIAILDVHAGVSYRQHGANVIGANRGMRSLPARLRRYFRGAHRGWALQNVISLTNSASRLTPEHRQTLACFSKALAGPLPSKIAALRHSGVYYQSPQARIAFWLSVILGGF